MTKLIFRIIFTGILIGAVCAVSCMVIGLIIFYGGSAVDIYLPFSYLRYFAVASFLVGAAVMFACYIYVLFIVRQFMTSALKGMGMPDSSAKL